MSTIQGGDWCTFNTGALAVATASLYFLAHLLVVEAWLLGWDYWHLYHLWVPLTRKSHLVNKYKI